MQLMCSPAVRYTLITTQSRQVQHDCGNCNGLRLRLVLVHNVLYITRAVTQCYLQGTPHRCTREAHQAREAHNCLSPEKGIKVKECGRLMSQ